MIRFKQGNIVEDASEAIVNTVNCVGVMGRGIALAFKASFPANFAAYAGACARHEVAPGRMFVFETGQLTPPRYIINFPTKRHWRASSRIEDIESGLDALVCEIETRGIRSVAVPPLGCGLGGLDWSRVRPLIVAALTRLPEVQTTVYEPVERVPSTIVQCTTKPPSMTVSRAVLVMSVQRYLNGMLDPVITLLELHKLLFFIQEAGQPLRLRFEAGHYGPYSTNLRFVLRNVNHHFVELDMGGGDNPTAEVSLLPSAVEKADAALRADPQALKRMQRVFDLAAGWETPHGLELLATAYWVVKYMNAKGIEEIVRQTYEWNPRKRQFTERQISLAHSALVDHGWLGASPDLQ